MDLRRSLLAVPALALACASNTIDLETEGSTGDGMGSSAGDPDPTRDPADSSGPGPGPGTATATDTATADTGIVEPEPMMFLLAIETSIAPGLPLQGIVTTIASPAGVDLTLQWLSLDQGSTTGPREPVGDVYAYPGLAVDGEGGFTWDTGVLLLPGAANPITGSDLVVSAQLEVVPRGSPYCGTVSGEVTSPIQAPLAGSTHAMTTIFDVSDLPVDFPVSCP